MTATPAQLKARIEKLRQQHHPARWIVLFGDEEPPEDLSEQDTVVRFEWADRGLL